ncbi:hypothetical protein vseg_006385 [Gypsophila vaccaria]
MGTNFHRVISEKFDEKLKIGVKNEPIESEPTSVLDHGFCPNSPNSRPSSTNDDGGGRGGLGNIGGGVCLAMHDFEDLCVGGVEGSLLPWLMGQVDDPNSSSKNFPPFGFGGFEGSIDPSCVENFGGGGGLGFSSFGSNCNGKVGEEFRFSDEKARVVGTYFGCGEHEVQTVQNPNYCVSSLGYSQVGVEHLCTPPVRRDSYGGAGLDRSIGQLPMAPQIVHKSMDQDKDSEIHVFGDQLIMVSEMFQTGNFALAQVILARLNHQASLPGNSLVGAAAGYVKEELEKILSMNVFPAAPPPPKSLSLDDVIHKISAYKLFSEVSPVMQFVDYTCTQAFLEALEGDDVVHILDFDIGCGSMWASFIRELPLRKKGAPLLKITVLASTSSHHPFELALICDNILEFATEYGVSVDIKVLNLDLFDSTSSTFPGFQLLQNEVVAVKFPIWACSHCPFLLPPLLSFMKQCSPKIVMTFDRGGDRSDLAFSSHTLHCLNSWSSLLESLNSSSIRTEIISKVDNFLIKPSIERTIQGRIHAPDTMHANKMHNWKTLFQNAGFNPGTFSTSTEYQADELVNQHPQKGFNVEKRRGSIMLRWRHHELVAGIAWNC